MENKELEMLSTMVTSALAKIIDERNSKSDFTVEDVMSKCFVNTESNEEFERSVDFRINLICKLLDNAFDDIMEQWKIGNNWTRGFTVTNFKTWFECATDIVKEQVREYIGSQTVNAETVTNFLHNPDLHRQDIIDILDNADVSNVLREEWYDDIVNDFFEDSDGSEIVEKCSYRQEEQLKDYFADNIEDDFKERAKDAINNM